MASALRNKVLVLNSGSSSLKFKLYQVGSEAAANAAKKGRSGGAAAAAAAARRLHPIAAGLVERIGDPEAEAVMRASYGTDRWRDGERVSQPMADHGTALGHVSRFLARSAAAAASAGRPPGGQPDPEAFQREMLGVGHRVVHGASLKHSVVIDEKTQAVLREACQLAPLHNPPSLYCIEAAQRLFPTAPHVAVFDTTFHASLEPEAYTYALPTELCRQHHIRRYGFHGISYSYLTHEAARLLGKPKGEVNLILCHLGAGSSMCAVQGGRSVDTSMGFTPLEGLVMGTRCGDIDAAIVPFLIAQGMTPAQVDETLNKNSGFKGMTGSIDVRSVEDSALEGDEACQLALAVYVRRVRKYLGAYLVHLGGRVDAVVFSAGVGENGSMLRDMICSGLEWAGIGPLDAAANEAAIRGKAGEVQAAGSRVKVLVIPTDEQLEIAEQTLEVVQQAQQAQQGKHLQQAPAA